MSNQQTNQPAAEKSLKKIRPTDKLQAYLVKFLSELLVNKTVILSIIGVVVVGGLGLWYYQNNQQTKQMARASALAAIDEKFHKENEAAEKLNEKNKPEGEDKAKPIKASHTESLKEYQDFFAANEKFPEAATAGIKAASILLKDNKLDEAKTILSKVMNHPSQQVVYKVFARLTLIEILEEEKKYDEALQEIEKVLGLAADDTKASVTLTKARIQWLKGNKDEAKATCALLIEKFASAPEAQKARAFKAYLNQI